MSTIVHTSVTFCI